MPAKGVGNSMYLMKQVELVREIWQQQLLECLSSSAEEVLP